MTVTLFTFADQTGNVPASELDFNFQSLLDLIMGDLELTAAAVEISSSGNNTVIAAVPLKRISVHKAFIGLASSTTVAFKSDVTTTIMGPFTTTGFVWDADSNPYLITAVGEALTLVLGTAVATGGALYYQLVD